MPPTEWPGTPRQPASQPSSGGGAPSWPGTENRQQRQRRPFRQPRRMRPPEERAVDPQLAESERAEARSQMARSTQASRDIPARQQNVVTPTPEDGTLGDVMDAAARVFSFRWSDPAAEATGQPSVFDRAGRYLTGQNRRQEDVGEISYQSIPERNGQDVRWEGGPLSGFVNSLPPEARAWLDAEGRAARIGAGFFLNVNEDDRAAIIRNNVPTSEFRRDQYGNLQVRFSPQTPWAYINRPGVSVQDAVDVASIIERYMPAARLAAAPQTILGRAAVGGGASAATEYGSQMADDMVGGPEGADMDDVAMAGAFGGGGQLAFDLAAASGQAAIPYVRRVLGVVDETPLPPPRGTAGETYGEPSAPPAQPRDFAAEREAIEQRAAADRATLDEQTFNQRVPGAADVEGNAVDINRATTLTPGQERVIDDHVRRIARVEQERRAAQARLDNEEFGTDLAPPSILHDAARRAMAEHTPVFVSTPVGVRRVVHVTDEGFIDELNQYHPSAGTVAEMTDDGLLFSTPPRPTGRVAPPKPAQDPAAPIQPPREGQATASEIYEMSDEFGIPVSRGEARQDVAQRTTEFDMLHGRYGPGAQRQAAVFQDQRADAIEQAGRRIATRGQDSLSRDIEDAGQIVQNQVRDRWHTLTQEINQAYDDAMRSLSEVPVDPRAGGTLEETVGRRLQYGRGNLDDEMEELLPTTGYDPDTIRLQTKSRTGTALRMIRSLQDEIVSRGAQGRNQVRFSAVERVRQRLLELQQDARTAADSDAYAMDLIVEGFDDWLGPALRRPPQIRITSPGAAFDYAEQQTLRQQAESAIIRARTLHSERERLFTRQNAGDLGGRTMETIRNLDTTGTQIINQIFGAGRIPPSQARATVERIRDIANRTTPSGTLAPAGERTTNLGRFEGNRAHPAPEIQAMREAMFMRVLEPLRTRGAGNQVPVQTIVNNLDTALNGPGRAITRALFTPDEVGQMEKLLSLLRYYVPTTASRPTGVMAARMLGATVDGITRFITGAPGMVLRGLIGAINPAVKDASGDLAARAAFSRPVLADGLPTTQSGAGLAQTVRDYGGDDSGADVPLEPLPAAPASTASEAYDAALRATAGETYSPGVDPARPIVSADAGERTITVEMDGRFYNIPTVVNGQRVSVSTALRMFEEGGNPAIGDYATEDEALFNARERFRQQPQAAAGF